MTNNDSAATTMPNKQDFLELLKSEFLMQYEDIQEKLTLVEVSSLTSDTIKDGQVEPFSLIFESGSATIQEQGVYQLSQDKLDDLDVFLVPIGASESSVQYEAIFT